MAAKHKCPECPEGAPDWLVSYGDMTTLLLCFFVFLLVTAKVDVDKLSHASGYMAYKMGLLPLNRNNEQQKTREEAKNGIPGDSQETTSIDEGKKLEIGGKEMFSRGSAIPDMTAEQMKRLSDFADKVRGYPNIIEVRGHASNDEKSGHDFEDAMDLSLERARAIRDKLVKTYNIDEKKIRIVGCSYHESVSTNVYERSRKRNRRVEIRANEKYQESNPTTNIEE